MNKFISIVIVFLAIGLSNYLIGLNNKANQQAIELQNFKNNYIIACVSPTTSYDYCNCTFDYINSKYGLEGMRQLENSIRITGNYPQEVNYASWLCSNYL